MQSGGAGRDDRDIGAFEAVFHAHMARDHVDDAGGNEKGRDAAWAASRQLRMRVFDQRQTANARADVHPDAHSLLVAERFVGGQTRIFDSLHRCGNAVVDEGVHRAGFLGSHVVFHIEALDLARDLAGKGAGIEFGDRPNARLPGQQSLPGSRDGISYRADTAQTSDDNTTLAHNLSDIHDLKQKRAGSLAAASPLVPEKLRPFGACWRSQSLRRQS